MKKEFTLSTVIAFILGLGIGNFTSSRKTHNTSDSNQYGTKQAQEKLQMLTDQQVTEYYQLKSDSEKIKAADEILAKMMTIFLHDLGIRISRNVLDQSVASLERHALDPAIPTAQPGTKTTSKEGDPAVAEFSTTSWKRAERLRHEIKNELEAAEFLDKVKIENFDKALKDTKPFLNRTGTLQNVQGQFQGRALIKRNEKYRNWDVEVFLDGNLDKGSLQGNAKVRIAENGKVFSNSSDNGKLKSFREFNSGSDAILVRASPSIYFQMYFLKDNNTLVGNIYEQDSDSESYNHIGTLDLKRN